MDLWEAAVIRIIHYSLTMPASLSNAARRPLRIHPEVTAQRLGVLA